MSIPYDPTIAENSKFPVNKKDPADDPAWVTYEEFVTDLVKEMGSFAANIHHMGTGAAGEGGELLDATKKVWVYGKVLDRANVIEELGDIEFYISGLRQMLGISRYEVLAGNIKKLQARYKGGYSDAAAIERADKKVELQVIDVTSPEYRVKTEAAATADNPPISQDQINAVDEQALVIHDWCVPLLAAYHAGKKVVAIAYTKNTATVLFDGDSNPYKLYRPKDEV